MALEPKERFLKLFEITESGCWIWKSSKCKNGYGWFWLNRKYIYAHRASWMFLKGEIPPDLHVCHHCDTPLCVNPEHLFLGTRKDNLSDASKKHRFIGTRKRRKLTADDVAEVRFGEGTYIALANKFHVTTQVIWRIKTGRAYKELPT